jgi:L-alanine-DL-glutamate epimerase-like enolase superfamily enzyme
MKIKDVRTEVYLREQPNRIMRQDFPRLSMLGGQMKRSRTTAAGKVPFTIVRITTDDGIEGFSFGTREIAEPIASHVKAEIVGRDPLDREWIWQRLWYLYDRGRHMPFPHGAISAVDIALWDIAGKSAGVPIYKLMGAYRDKIKIYASSWGKETHQEYVDEAVACKEQGISAYKIHPYWRTGEKDIETCRAVRKAVGPDMKLMLDVAGHYDREEALRVGKELEDLDFTGSRSRFRTTILKD